MKKILDYINNLSEGKFIALAILVALVCTVPFDFFKIYSNTYMGLEFSGTMSFGWDFLVAVIIGPIVESILIVIVSKLIGQATDNKFMITFITAILLSGIQNYSLPYAIIIFIPSFIFVSAYTLYKNNKKFNSFSIMVIINMLYSVIQIGFTILAKKII
ncbi:hypothetical protein [Paraclostridium bifermentans]|uniref:hypothetical protein n=1 Tax=Paraclostridium bifermentans TaxID=1490 RepID=UPI001C7E6C56|nr:hypothetical protein [Paraclostridium bifermentans]GIM32081.1 hypothetical protein PAGU1678_13510 [Paraclostridium bifermentans subsp. muricolitidis]